MELEILILSEVRKKKTNTYMWNLKYGTNEPVERTEEGSQGRGGGTGVGGLLDANYYI